MTALRPGCRTTGTPGADELHAPGHAGVSGMAPDTLYEIRVLGSLDQR